MVMSITLKIKAFLAFQMCQRMISTMSMRRPWHFLVIDKNVDVEPVPNSRYPWAGNKDVISCFQDVEVARTTKGVFQRHDVFPE
jgi:hypothetical protein